MAVKLNLIIILIHVFLMGDDVVWVHVLVVPLSAFMGERSVETLCPHLNSVICLFIVEL